MNENNLLDARMVKFNYVKSIANPYPDKFQITHSLDEASILPDDTKMFG